MASEDIIAAVGFAGENPVGGGSIMHRTPLLRKLPTGWKARVTEEGNLELTHPPPTRALILVALALALGAASWIFVGPGVADTLRRGDFGLGLSLSFALLVLNGFVGAALWVAANLRDRWLMGHNFLDVREPTLDANMRVTTFIGANLRIVHREVEEGGGWALRVSTKARMGDLHWASKPKLPCTLGAMLADATGWTFDVPPELRALVFAALSGTRAMPHEPPPGMGFKAVRDADGTIRMRRWGAVSMTGVSLLLAGLFFVWGTGAIWLALALRFGWPEPWLVFGIVGAVGTVMMFYGVKMAFVREYWRLNKDFLEIREVGLFRGRSLQFLGGTLTLIRLSTSKGQTSWRLVVLARNSQGTLSVDFAPDGPLVLGEYISGLTGWRLQLPEEVKKQVAGPDLGAPAAEGGEGAAAGGGSERSEGGEAPTGAFGESTPRQG